MHPNILTESRDRELSDERLRGRQPDELFALCEKVSIDDESQGRLFRQQISDCFNGT